jgi:hypothetical protein
LHIQDREDASTTGESSDESESENENESDSDSESDKWSERDSNSDSESETHNESYEDPAEVLDKEELKNAYNVLRLEFTDSNTKTTIPKLLLRKNPWSRVPQGPRKKKEGPRKKKRRASRAGKKGPF